MKTTASYPARRLCRQALMVYTLSAGALTLGASAEPIVLGDFGGVPTGVPDRQSVREAGGRLSVRPIPREIDQFPLTTTLTVGVVERRAHGREINRPIFIVGADAESRKWLDSNRDALAARGALGLLTEARSEAEAKAVLERAGALELRVAPADEVAASFGISRYPVLIDTLEIVQ